MADLSLLVAAHFHSRRRQTGNPTYRCPRDIWSARHTHYHWRNGNYRGHRRADLSLLVAVLAADFHWRRRQTDNPMYRCLWDRVMARHTNCRSRNGNYRHHPKADLEAAAAHPVVSFHPADHSDRLRYGNPMYLCLQGR